MTRKTERETYNKCIAGEHKPKTELPHATHTAFKSKRRKRIDGIPIRYESCSLTISYFLLNTLYGFFSYIISPHPMISHAVPRLAVRVSARVSPIQNLAKVCTLSSPSPFIRMSSQSTF